MRTVCVRAVRVRAVRVRAVRVRAVRVRAARGGESAERVRAQAHAVGGWRGVCRSRMCRSRVARAWRARRLGAPSLAPRLPSHLAVCRPQGSCRSLTPSRRWRGSGTTSWRAPLCSVAPRRAAERLVVNTVTLHCRRPHTPTLILPRRGPRLDDAACSRWPRLRGGPRGAEGRPVELVDLWGQADAPRRAPAPVPASPLRRAGVCDSAPWPKKPPSKNL